MKNFTYGMAALLGAVASFFIYKTVKEIDRENEHLRDVMERFKNK